MNELRIILIKIASNHCVFVCHDNRISVSLKNSGFLSFYVFAVNADLF